MFIAILSWFLLFMFLVIVHELWHFIAAKKSWVKVLEFGIWIPPKAFKIYTDKSGTEYTINWIPLWGFVRLKWENPEDEWTFYAKDSFISQNIWKKLLILVWWVTVNLFFAWLFFAMAFWKWVEPISIVPESMLDIDNTSYIMATRDYLDENWFLSGSIETWPVEVMNVMPDSTAEEIWITTWTIIKSINNLDVDTSNLSSTLKDNIWEEFSISFEKDWQDFEENAECWHTRCMLWIAMKQYWDLEVLPVKFWFIDWAIAAWWEIWAQTKLTLHVLGNVVTQVLSFEKEQAKEAVENLAWPVGAVKVWEMLLEHFGIWHYIAFGGMISLALAIFNILPLPALDGGRALWVIIQTVWKFKPEKYFIIENYFNFFFFMLLMALGIYIIFLDLARFWGVNPFGMWF